MKAPKSAGIESKPEEGTILAPVSRHLASNLSMICGGAAAAANVGNKVMNVGRGCESGRALTFHVVLLQDGRAMRHAAHRPLIYISIQ
jgi:hypothetical protein